MSAYDGKKICLKNVFEKNGNFLKHYSRLEIEYVMHRFKLREQGSISPTFYEQLLQTQIPKVQKRLMA